MYDLVINCKVKKNMSDFKIPNPPGAKKLKPPPELRGAKHWCNFNF